MNSLARLLVFASLSGLALATSASASIDTDSDGIDDLAETNTGIYISATNTGTNPNSADTDADGVPDGLEVKEKTSPVDATKFNSFSKGMVAYYPFNGNANDESGRGNHGSVNGATLIADRFGDSSKSYSFDGISSYIQVSDNTHIRPQSQVTISTWININKLQSYERIISKGLNVSEHYASYQIITGSNLQDTFYDAPLFTIQTASGYRVADPEAGQPINKWIHVCGTYDGSKSTLYYRGAMVAQIEVNGDIWRC